MAEATATLMGAGTDVSAKFQRCQALLRHYAKRDAETAQMRAVRRGDFEAIAPGSFTEDFPSPIIANRIDTMARDMAATLSALPTFSCLPSSTLNDKAKKFADKRTKIAQHYIESSFLQAQMPDACDSYHAYGMFVGEVRPDFECMGPKIKLLDGAYAYPVWDENFNTTEILLVSFMSEMALSSYYPDAASRMRDQYPGAIQQDRVRVYRYADKTETVVFLPDAANYILDRIPNKLGKCPYVAVPRPMGEDWFTVPRGAFADLIYPMIAANDFRMLGLEAVEKAVRAPIVVPTDVPNVPFGPDATIHTANPQGVGRLKVDVPQGAFQASDLLDRDMQIGGMSPGSRSGSVNASVITGRGVDALGEGYSQQVALAQSRLGVGLQKLVMLAFEMDEKFWPNEAKEIRGQSVDNPGRVTYTPSRDIAGDYSVTVDYGFLLGLDANRALVFILQAQAAGLISNDTAARNLPIKLNLAEEANRIQLEQLRNTLLQSVAASAQAIPQMMTAGQQPGQILATLAAIVEGVKKGDPIETVVSEVFKPPPPQPAGEETAPGEQTSGPEEMGPGEPGGAAPGGGGMPAPDQGPPDLQNLIAGLSASGNPNLRAGVMRQAPVAGA